ncbi:MAG TPA: hypothetical protein VHP35_21160, partial [Terriglobia bacterium]|nr:hypothetical protein [Terriglobia bacterium]
MNRIGQARVPEGSFGREQLRDLPAVRVIPYDYVADFNLTGGVGNLLQDVINIRAEGVFVAVSIGYGLNEERGEKLDFRPGFFPADPTLDNLTLGHIPPDVLIEGFRINPKFQAVAVTNGRLNDSLPLRLASDIFERLKQTENFSFLL